MALATLQAVIDALPGQPVEFNRAPPGSFGSGLFTGLWTGTGLPTPASNPSSGLAGDVPTSASTGALTFVNPASGGSSLARASAQSTSSTNGAVLVYDRLWQNSGIDATLNTGQTVNSVALTRPDALGANVEVWWHVYAAMGSGTPTVTLSYTNQAGTASKSASSGALATAMAAGRTGVFQLASGDTGVRSVQTWTASATFTSGTIGLVMRRLVAVVPLPIVSGPLGAATVFDILQCGLANVPNSACLELVFLASVVTSNPIIGHMLLAQG